MKAYVPIVADAMLLTVGCATSTIETRKQECLTSYSALSSEQRAAVDGGKIRVGMNMDAVYIAWGKPSETLTSESSNGTLVTWLYRGTYLQEYRYWTPHQYYYRRGWYATPYPAYDYYPQSYVSAEVTFEGGAVKQWRTLPSPGD